MRAKKRPAFEISVFEQADRHGKPLASGALAPEDRCLQKVLLNGGTQPPCSSKSSPSSADPAVFPSAESPLWGLPLVQSSVRPAGIALMGSAIPRCRLPFSSAGGFPNRPSPAEGLVSANAPLIEFSCPPGSCPDDASRSLSAPAPSMGSCSLGHMHRTRSGSRGLCLPATFRPQGLITLSTACALARLASLVSCRQRLWDSPFEAFSSSKVALALRPPHDPLAVTIKAPPSWTFGPRRLRALKLGYQVLPSASPSRRSRVFSPTHRRRLPWVSPLSGFSSARLGRSFDPPPLTRLAAVPVAQDDPLRAAECRSTSGYADHRWPVAPLRVFTPQRPWHEAVCREPGLCVHLASRRTLPCDRRPLLGSTPADRSCQGR